MNTDTGEIHEMQPNETLKELASRLKVLETSLVELSNPPDPQCENCRGLGYRGISQAGKKIPCQCTNPK